VKQQKVKQTRQEMWWVILAKSKTLRFFAVSCEFILFLGGLWITFTVNDPESKTWLSGNVNLVFLTVMGWAVDAAMPEAWLHVVIQHVQKERGQLGWSKFVAGAISVLFIGNIIYSVFTGGDTTDGISGAPKDATGWILLVLVILRISVGFVYITVRQCQEWIKRQPDHAAPPALAFDSWPLVGLAAWFQQELQMTLANLSASFDQRLDERLDREAKKYNLLDLQVSRLRSEVQDLQALPIDYDMVTHRVLTQLKADFDAWKQTQLDALEHASQLQLDASTPASELRQKSASRRKNDASTKIITMRQPAASSTEKKAAIHRLLDEDQSLSSYRLAALVGCSEPTARRIKNEYIDVRHDAAKLPYDASGNDASDRVM